MRVIKVLVALPMILLFGILRLFATAIKDASIYEEEIQLVSLMRMDFELLEEIIEDLDESDSKIMKQYLLEGRLFKEIADDEGRTYEAIKKRMERIRAEIREEMLECLEMNCRGGE